MKNAIFATLAALAIALGGCIQNSSETSSGANANPGQGNTGSAPSQGGSSLAADNILWKPVSEGDGSLVVLTAPNAPRASVSVRHAGGREDGRYVGHTNGNRATYRFSRPGGDYQSGCSLIVGSKTYSITYPSQRSGQ